MNKANLTLAFSAGAFFLLLIHVIGGALASGAAAAGNAASNFGQGYVWHLREGLRQAADAPPGVKEATALALLAVVMIGVWNELKKPEEEL